MTARTQTTDLNVNSGHAITYDSSGDSWTIGTGVTVSDTSEATVYCDKSSGILFNNGNISSSDIGVEFQFANGFEITNNTNHYIIGSTDGLDLALSDAGTVTNKGSIISSLGVGIEANSSNTEIITSGEIFGHTAGIEWFNSTTTSKLENSGLIASDREALVLHDALLVNNDKAGVIRGATVAIDESGGALTLHNLGQVQGDIRCTATNAVDYVQNQGTITGEVHLGSGNDVFDGQGGTAGAVYGEDGNDTLIGGLGADQLFGGTGSDTFTFNTIAAIGKGAHHDVIEDFSEADLDVIDLHTIDANTKSAHDQAFKFIGSQHFHKKAGELQFLNGVLSGDVNGDGKADFQIGVANVATLHPGDFHL